LQVTDTVSAQRAAFEYLVKGIFVGGLKRKMRIIRSIYQAVIFSERLISKATIRLTTDQPSDHDNYLEVIRQRTGKWELKIKLELGSNVMQDSAHLHQIIAEALSKSGCLSKVYLPPLRTDKANKTLEYAWHDAAHYYGSIPAKSSNAQSPTVDENLQLQGFVNCYVVGSSAFPIGSHGHPTKLIMDLAVRLGVYLNEKTSSRSL
jgi:choline dehydrogenase-like flavoprotein